MSCPIGGSFLDTTVMLSQSFPFTAYKMKKVNMITDKVLKMNKKNAYCPCIAKRLNFISLLQDCALRPFFQKEKG